MSVFAIIVAGGKGERMGQDVPMLRQATGWENKVDFADGIAKTLAYWREVI